MEISKLSPQKKRIYELYKGGDWVCSTAILFIRDYRKRISEMNREGFRFESRKCDGRCGIKHAAAIHMYRLVDKPVEKKIEYVPVIANGVRMVRRVETSV